MAVHGAENNNRLSDFQIRCLDDYARALQNSAEILGRNPEAINDIINYELDDASTKMQVYGLKKDINK